MIGEKELQQQVVELAKICGWRVLHVFPLMTKHGWRTPTTWSGWPDLTLIRPPGELVFLELKGPRTPITDDQVETIAYLSTLDHADARIVNGDDWDWIQERLSRRPVH